MNQQKKSGPGFSTKEDTQQFIKGSLPKLKETGYNFKTEGKNNEFSDGNNDNASASNASSMKSWSSAGSHKPASEDQVVFVDLPKFLPPKQLWELVQPALHSKGIQTKDCTVTFTKLRWSMGSIRKPKWPLSARGPAKIARAVLTMTSENEKDIVATVRSKSEWDNAREEWVAKRPAKQPTGQSQQSPQPQSVPMQAPVLPIGAF